ncbi:hypothetical protein B566_EDAN009422 [Ephemera danica]|nr:hypothetical protein B566_EDAN009422 [Ephemera danica]
MYLTLKHVNDVSACLQRDEELVRAVKLTSRERRFIKFASVEYNSQLTSSSTLLRVTCTVLVQSCSR